MQRPILIALIGYILGIISGLYLKISIVFLYPMIIICILLIKQIINYIKNKKVRRILKTILFSKSFNKAITIIFISALISNISIKYTNNKYETKYKDEQKSTFVATVLEEKKEKNYYLQYKIRIEQINNKKAEGHYLLLKLKNKKQKLQVGNKIQFNGEYQEPQIQRNEKGFNYKLYLKTQKIYGIVTTDSIKILKNQNLHLFSKISNKIVQYSTKTIQNLIKDTDQQNLLLGLLIGKDDNISQELKETFSNSSLSHILAISGMHISYIILGITTVFENMGISKRVSRVLLIILLILFCEITMWSTTVIRAVFMAIISIIASLMYKKNDTITTMSIILLVTLINNPFSIFDIGIILSYAGTIGILAFYKILINKFYDKHKELFLANNLKITEKIHIKIVEIALVSLSAQTCILPIILYNFNNLSITFLISNILTSFLIGPILILGFILILSNTIFPIIANLIVIPLKILLNTLITIATFTSNLPLSHILIPTPKIYTILLYYIIILIFYYLIKYNKLPKFIKKIYKNRKKLLIIITTMFVVIILGKCNQNLSIHFIDVGQGDSTLIITKNKKTILIDGGGSSSNEFDVGKSTLLPYLLDKGINKIDYIIVSHFDTDHVRFYPIFATRDKSKKCYHRKTI